MQRDVGAGGRSQVFIDDLLCALRELEIDSTITAGAVMRMLCLEDWNEIVALVSPEQVPASPSQTATQLAEELPTALPASPVPASAERAAPSKASAGSVEVTIRRLPAGDTPAPPAWLRQVPPLARAVRASSRMPEPLFDPRQEWALLGALSACLGRDGDLHVERLLDDIARGSVPVELPLRESWGTRRGLQLLVDDGPGMAPFRRDVERLWGRLGDLLPADRLSRLAFEGCPGRGCRTLRRRGSRPWAPPDAGSAVLVLTDFGIANVEPSSGAASLGEWLAFCARADAAGVQLRSLTPYPAHRWPPALVGRLHPVAWDRQTAAATVRRAVAAAAHQRIA